MTKISSNSTFFYKKAFPILWFGFMAGCVGTTLLSGALVKDALFLLPGLIIPCLMVGAGFLLFRKLLWNLADEVYDGGDYLLVRNRGEEDNVALANIVNVNASTMINPPRVTLSLARPGKIRGRDIVFAEGRLHLESIRQESSGRGFDRACRPAPVATQSMKAEGRRR